MLCEEQTFTQKLHPSSFYIPEFILKGSYLPDAKVKYQLFDRVVNVKTSIIVPFGAKGTVIGIYSGNDHLNRFTRFNNAPNEEVEEEKKSDDDLLSSTIEVLFDEPFEGGFSERSSKSNIFKMHASYLINISHGMRMSKKNVNFKNVYQPIQSTGHKQSTHYQNNSRPHFNHNNHQLQTQKSSNIPINNTPQKIQIMPRPEQFNESPNKFNHSENSRFKAISKPSYAGIVVGSNVQEQSSIEQGFQPSNEAIHFPNNLPLPPSCWSSDVLGQMFSGINIRHANPNQMNNTTPTKIVNPIKNPELPPPPPPHWIESIYHRKK